MYLGEALLAPQILKIAKVDLRRHRYLTFDDWFQVGQTTMSGAFYQIGKTMIQSMPMEFDEEYKNVIYQE